MRLEIVTWRLNVASETLQIGIIHCPNCFHSNGQRHSYIDVVFGRRRQANHLICERPYWQFHSLTISDVHSHRRETAHRHCHNDLTQLHLIRHCLSCLADQVMVSGGKSNYHSNHKRRQDILHRMSKLP